MVEFVVVAEFVITARKRSLRRLCFYRCLSVHRGACVARGGGGACVAGDMHGMGRAWWGADMHGGWHAWHVACMVGGMCEAGCAWLGVCVAGGGMHATADTMGYSL